MAEVSTLTSLLVFWDRLAPWLPACGGLLVAGVLVWVAGCLAWDLVQRLWSGSR